MRLKKFKKLRIGLGAKSSRFVIDLKQEPTLTEFNEVKNKNLIIESKLEKLAELDYKKYFNDGKKITLFALFRFKNSFFKHISLVLTFFKAKDSKLSTLKSKKNKSNLVISNNLFQLLNQMAFISLAKFLWIIFFKIIVFNYKICYSIGWLALFIIRYIYLLAKIIIKPVAINLARLAKKAWPHTASFFSSWLVFFNNLYQSVLKIRVKYLSIRTNRISHIKETLPVETVDNHSYPTSNKFGYFKPALVFAGVLLILVLPVKAYTYYKTIDNAKGKVLGASEVAFNNLISGGQAAAGLDFIKANQSFSSAGDNFLTAQNQLNDIHGLLFTLASVIPNKSIQLVAASKNIIRAGELSAAAGKNLSLAVAGLVNFQSKDINITLNNLITYGQAATLNLTELINELEHINSASLPETYQNEFILLKQKISELASGLNEFIGLADNLKTFLGSNEIKRYLLVFQNNAELRASGGFIGSYALIDFLNGKIKNIEVPGGGSYDTDAGMLKKIKSPLPLSLIRPDWHFWDANWWPDWPTSAKKLAWFYENSDGPTVDGVIGLTPTVIEKILKIIGPIDLKEKYGVVIDADNFWLVTQQFAEQKPDLTKKPKAIIGDLLNKILEELPLRINKGNLVDLLKSVEESLVDKNILFYFTDTELKAKAEVMGWDGSIKNTDGDYLSVINTNIAGGKSDRKIKQEIIHSAQIMNDGRIIDSLIIKRTHEGVKREPLVGVRNVDWLRVYVPLGAKLISASGFKPVDKIFFKTQEAGWENDPDVLRAESNAQTDDSSGTKIYEELNKTVFANWSQLDPGETIEIKLEYELPFKLTRPKIKTEHSVEAELLAKASAAINSKEKNLYSYSLLVQKQPGMNSSSLNSQLELSDNFKSIWKFPADLGGGENGWLINENFNQDSLSAIMVEEK